MNRYLDAAEGITWGEVLNAHFDADGPCFSIRTDGKFCMQPVGGIAHDEAMGSRHEHVRLRHAMANAMMAERIHAVCAAGSALYIDRLLGEMEAPK